ncbi:MAG: hypothetical protein ACI85F_002456, partial [Bacteroidia bacterium]
NLFEQFLLSSLRQLLEGILDSNSRLIVLKRRWSL